MDDIETIQAATFQLYHQLIGKVINKTPLTERERIAYFALDFRVRLEMHAFDGIMQNPQAFIDSLIRLGLMTHARKLRHAVRLGADRIDWDYQARHACEVELGAIADEHLDGDNMVFDRAVVAFWEQSEG